VKWVDRSGLCWEHRPGGLECGVCGFTNCFQGVFNSLLEGINQRAQGFDTLLLHQPQAPSLQRNLRLLNCDVRRADLP